MESGGGTRSGLLSQEGVRGTGWRRLVNIHIRQTGSPTSRYALLFRDFLRADADSREAWGEFKTRLAEAKLDIYAYGQIKATAQPRLMRLAEQWAADTYWST